MIIVDGGYLKLSQVTLTFYPLKIRRSLAFKSFMIDNDIKTNPQVKYHWLLKLRYTQEGRNIKGLNGQTSAFEGLPFLFRL